MHRREFTCGIVTGAISAPVSLLSGNAHANVQDESGPSVADQLLNVLKARLGDRLTDEQWKQVRGKIEGQLATAKTLGEFKLQNSDEPATVFAARQAHSHL